jgi:hypothetical protein
MIPAVMWASTRGGVSKAHTSWVLRLIVLLVLTFDSRCRCETITTQPLHRRCIAATARDPKRAILGLTAANF